MAVVADDLDQMPVVRKLADFDQQSGNLLERLVFNNRLVMVIVCAVLTVVLGYFAATRLILNASFEKMIPQGQPYIKNYLTYQKDLRGLGNAIRVVVENTEGDIFDPAYLEALRQINDELFLTPGVDRAWVKSLWTPAVRWTEVTEDGFRGGPVMPDSYDGSPKTVEQLKATGAAIRFIDFCGREDLNRVMNQSRIGLVPSVMDAAPPGVEAGVTVAVPKSSPYTSRCSSRGAANSL